MLKQISSLLCCQVRSTGGSIGLYGFCLIRPILFTVAVALCWPTERTVLANGSGKLDRDSRQNETVTFNRDIAPIIHSKCSNCHRPGQVGPFSLVSFNDVAKRARTIQAVIDSGYMPPWKPVDHGLQFENDRRLSDTEVSKINQWIKGGKPRGSGPEPTPPKFVDGWSLGKPDLVVSMNGKFQVPASGDDIYRSFVFPLQLPQDKWVKAIEYRPTATSSVHHAIFYVDESGKARELDGTDGSPGIPGMGFLSNINPVGQPESDQAKPRLGNLLSRLRDRGASSLQSPNVADRMARGLGGFVPGATPTKLPGDLALKLPKNSDIVMQTHFHPTGKVEFEQGKIALYLTDKPPSKRIVPIQIPAMFGVGVGLKVPAGESDYKVTESFTVPVDVQLINIGAHAHYICKSVRMTATLPGGKSKTLIEIDDWDLDWQDRYQFQNPISIPAGTVLTSELVYDNSANNPENPNSPPKEIRWGRQSEDEMGSVSVSVVAANESDRPKLASSLGRYYLRSMTQGDLVDLIMQLDTNRDGGLQVDEAPPRLAQSFRFLDRDRDGKLDRDELAIIRSLMPANRGVER